MPLILNPKIELSYRDMTGKTTYQIELYRIHDYSKIVGLRWKNLMSALRMIWINGTYDIAR